MLLSAKQLKILSDVGLGVLSLGQVELAVRQGKVAAFEDNLEEFNEILFEIYY